MMRETLFLFSTEEKESGVESKYSILVYIFLQLISPGFLSLPLVSGSPYNSLKYLHCFFSTFDVRNNIRKKYRTPIRERTIIWINRKTGDLIGAGGERM